jgi:hypothetical protein
MVLESETTSMSPESSGDPGAGLAAMAKVGLAASANNIAAVA